MKKKSKVKQAHTANTQIGMGNFYGTAMRAKMGKMRQMYPPGANPPQPKSLKKPPRTLA